MSKRELPDPTGRAHATVCRLWFYSLGTLLPFAAAGCTESPTSPSGGANEITELPRALSAAEGRIIEASNRFAFGLLAQANRPNENLFLSPLSASMALGMTMNGAAGET